MPTAAQKLPKSKKRKKTQKVPNFALGKFTRVERFLRACRACGWEMPQRVQQAVAQPVQEVVAQPVQEVVAVTVHSHWLLHGLGVFTMDRNETIGHLKRRVEADGQCRIEEIDMYHIVDHVARRAFEDEDLIGDVTHGHTPFRLHLYHHDLDEEGDDE